MDRVETDRVEMDKVEMDKVEMDKRILIMGVVASPSPVHGSREYVRGMADFSLLQAPSHKQVGRTVHKLACSFASW